MAEHKYPLDNEWKHARERLGLLETVWDPWTIRCLLKVGVGEGWRCLEVAGGGGSIAQWLCRRVGPTGHVVATDLQPHFLQSLGEPNLEPLRHDIIRDPLAEGSFDLVHARALLTFLPEPAPVLAKMVAALKPGGWLLVEEPDYASGVPDPSMREHVLAVSQKGLDAMLLQLRAQGYDTEFGRHLYHDVAVTGLADLQAEGCVDMQLGGSAWARFWRITFEQLQEGIQDAGLLSSEDCAAYRTSLESRDHRWLNILCMSVWGRKS